MKWLDTNSIEDIARGPESLEEQDEATEAWKLLRHLTSCADPDGAESYALHIQTRGGIFVAEYTALESTSFYRETGFGADPIAALRNMHDCVGERCDDPKHDAARMAEWRERFVRA